MKYTMDELFSFMDSARNVKVTSTSGKTYCGRCWAYGDVQNAEDNGVDEPSLDVGPGITLYASEIEKIEFAD